MFLNCGKPPGAEESVCEFVPSAAVCGTAHINQTTDMIDTLKTAAFLEVVDVFFHPAAGCYSRASSGCTRTTERIMECSGEGKSFLNQISCKRKP